jgi:Schlafen, AlbA_2
MLAVLEKPLETLAKADVDALIGWSESESLEFNEALPGKDGKPDPWLSGGNVARYAKDELFKEIVALANTAGGHLFVGIEESEDRPPIAKSIKPLPRCADLAERLKQAAYSLIEPPIRGLNAVGVSTTEDGSGVVVFRVPQSRTAPHRSSDRESYVRRGSESAPMTMREIQDLTIHLSRRIDELKARFESAHVEFLKWFDGIGLYHDGAIGFRTTAVPVGVPLYIERVEPVTHRILKIDQLRATLAGIPVVLHPFHDDGRAAIPVFRGARRELADDRGATWFSASCDGVIETKSKLKWATSARDDSGRLTNVFYLGWILNYVANVIRAAQTFATIAGVPECEYAMTFEIHCTNGAADIPLRLGDLISGDLGEVASPLVLEEPMSLDDRDELMSRVMRDFYDACHVRLPDPPTLKIEKWD